jgi:hypothetical protein
VSAVERLAQGLRYNPDTRTYIVSAATGAFVIDTPYSETAIHWWRLHHPDAPGPAIETDVVRHSGPCSECPGCEALRQADRARRGLEPARSVTLAPVTASLPAPARPDHFLAKE